MLLVLIAAALGVGAAPQATNRDAWLRASDHRRPDDGPNLPATRIELTIDENGEPIHCNIVSASDAKGFDNRLCAVPMRHAHFKPARDENGQLVTGVFSTDLTTGAPLGRGAPWADYTLTVSAMPARHAATVARVMTDAAGHVESCVVETSSGSAPLDEAACRYTRATLALAAPFDRYGRPVRAMRLVTIGFSTGN